MKDWFSGWDLFFDIPAGACPVWEGGHSAYKENFLKTHTDRAVLATPNKAVLISKASRRPPEAHLAMLKVRWFLAFFSFHFHFK